MATPKTPKSARKVLTLNQRLEVINMSEKQKLSSRVIAERVGVGRTQIQSILKRLLHLKHFTKHQMH